MFDHYDTLNYSQKVLDKKTTFEKFEEKITEVIETYNESKKVIDKRELSKLIKNYIGENKFKIEEEKPFAKFKNDFKDFSKAGKQNQYVELINKLLFMNIVDDSKNQFITQIDSIKKQENIFKHKLLLDVLDAEKMDCEHKKDLVEIINKIREKISDIALKDIYDLFS